MKTLQNQYTAITEGKGNKDHFLKQARHLFPELLTVNTTFNDAITILKGKNILTEAVGGIVTQNPNKPDWFKIFNTNIKEAVGVKDKKEYGDQNTFEKIDKDVAKDLESNFDNSNPKNIDNVYGQSFLIGYLAEMDDPKNAEKTVDELKQIVAKNMAKDINYYAKNGMFAVKGIGLETSTEPKAPKGKYKSSGYGDLKENKENKPENPYSLYKSHPKFKEAEQAIAKALKTATKREDVENILKNYREAGADDTASREAIFAAFNKKLRESETRSVGPMIKSKEFKVGDKVKYKGMNHEITRIVDDRIYIKNLKYGGRPDTWVKASDLKESYEYESKLRSLVRNLIKEELNEGYGMSLEDAKVEAQRISQEEGVVQHVEETSEGSGEYRVSDWYDSDLTVASYQNGMEL